MIWKEKNISSYHIYRRQTNDWRREQWNMEQMYIPNPIRFLFEEHSLMKIQTELKLFDWDDSMESECILQRAVNRIVNMNPVEQNRSFQRNSTFQRVRVKLKLETRNSLIFLLNRINRRFTFNSWLSTSLIKFSTRFWNCSTSVSKTFVFSFVRSPDLTIMMRKTELNKKKMARTESFQRSVAQLIRIHGSKVRE